MQHLLSSVETLKVQQAQMLRLFEVFAHRLTDPTHLTIPEFAKLKGVSEKTVRNWISAGKIICEVIPGTKKSGIPVEEAHAGWIDRNVVHAAKARRRNG